MNLKKRILLTALALVFVLASLPAMAAEERYTLAEFEAAIEDSELVLAWTGICGASVEMAGGSYEIPPGKKIYLLPTPEEVLDQNKVYIAVYSIYEAANGELVYRADIMGVTDMSYLDIRPLDLMGYGGGYELDD